MASGRQLTRNLKAKAPVCARDKRRCRRPDMIAERSTPPQRPTTVALALNSYGLPVCGATLSRGRGVLTR